jgi:hypothetical protein
VEFTGFPKMARLNRDIVITEKIDGTNAQVYIAPFHDSAALSAKKEAIAYSVAAQLIMFAGSRTRWITPTDDNHGFAKWVQANAEDLFRLGQGQHFGEWWGSGIQRGYGLQKGEKRFSLFNTARWGKAEDRPSCCHVVPTLYTGLFDADEIDEALHCLRLGGSFANLGFMKPEGIVIWHEAARQLFKVTLEKDEMPKTLA